MLDVFTVSFFGHRDFSLHNKIEQKLFDIIYQLISEHDYVDFLVGRNGEFDQFVTSTLRLAKQKFSSSDFSIIWILPYETADLRKNKVYYDKYYDEIEICSFSSCQYFKSSIQSRNREMINRSQLVICYVDKKCGGAFQSIEYAKKQGKEIINLANEKLFL